MKSKFNLLTVLFIFVFCLAAAGAEEIKEYNESWPVSEVQSLSISNKFGEIRVNNNGSDEVTIDVVVTVNASTESKAKKMLEQIDVDFRKSGGNIRAITSIDNDFRGQKEFSIDYTVNIPSDKNLEISNKFGNTFINELNASGRFSIEHGNFNALTLNGKNVDEMKIDLAFGKVTVDELTFGKLDIKHSTAFIGESTDLIINSSHSVFNIEEANSIEADSKFDSFSFEEVEEFRGSTQHSNLKIDELGNILVVESGYGGIKVEEVNDNFELIDIRNKFGSIKLGIDDGVSYDLKASCTHCDIDFIGEFRGNRMTENFKKEVEGKVGTGTSTAKVNIISEFGGIKLR